MLSFWRKFTHFLWVALLAVFVIVKTVSIIKAIHP